MNRQELFKPDFRTALVLYPRVYAALKSYQDYVDNQGDPSGVQYLKLESDLALLVDKDLSKVNLYEAWEAEGLEVLSFKVALPDPIRVDDITQEELYGVIYDLQNLSFIDKPWEELSFKQRFEIYTDEFYHEFLRLNFKTYNFKKIFGKNKDGSWPDENQIVGKLLDPKL